jgi:homoserine O-acetyltransferase
MCKPENATLTQATVLGMMTTGMQTALNIAKQLAIFAALLAALFLGQSPAQAASEPSVPPHEGDFVIHNFHFESGETLPHVKMHYTLFGAPKRDASGHTTNVVLILHGSSGGGRQFLRPIRRVHRLN